MDKTFLFLNETFSNTIHFTSEPTFFFSVASIKTGHKENGYRNGEPKLPYGLSMKLMLRLFRFSK